MSLFREDSIRSGYLSSLILVSSVTFMDKFLKKFLFLPLYFAFWILCMQCFRVLFVLSNGDISTIDGSREWLSVLYVGLKLDMSVAGYYTAIVGILSFLISILIPKYLNKVVLWASGILAFLSSLVVLVDLELYGHWSYKIDYSVFQYVDTPGLMLASTSWGRILMLVVIQIVVVLLVMRLLLYCRIVPKLERISTLYSLTLLLFVGVAILPIRGGLHTIPINVSAAYHSDKVFNNHAAINPIFNLLYSTLKGHKKDIPYDFLPAQGVKDILASNKARDNDAISVLDDDVNVVVIVWESLTAKLNSAYGDTTTLPYLIKLSKESMYFDNFYANGTRSDKGLVSIFSGYYPQTKHSIMKETAKARSLPSLFNSMKKEGYHSSFYYGGDVNFGSMGSYFREQGVDQIIDESYFSQSDMNSKWGANDHVVFDRLLDDLNKEDRKYLKVLFTITSHEPFEIPTEYKFGKETELQKFRSAHHYTDASLAGFITKAKQQEWWDSTVIVILADHGHPLPRLDKEGFSPSRFKIPMIWTGGAVQSQDTVIHTISSQVDFSYSLLKQMGIDNSEFAFSSDIFSADDTYAHYIFTNGFGTVRQVDTMVYDLDNRPSADPRNTPDSLLLLGQAITQHAFDDYLSR